LTSPHFCFTIRGMSDSFCAEWVGKRLLFALVIGCVLAARSAQANVYATNVKLNGGTTNLTVQAGEGISISYILNEPASLGVTINILAGATAVRSIALAPDGPGCQRGANTVMWDGLDDRSNNVPSGVYSVSITAQSSGYADWSQITDDLNLNNYVFNGRGIAVDRNPTNPYFGRIFVANSLTGFDPANTPGDALGILKFNADASTPEDGIVSTGGYDWPEDRTMGLGKVEVSADDRVYVSDLRNGGELLSWDPAFATNSFVQVLQPTNKPAGTLLQGLALTVQGTNAQLWMTDALGTNAVLRWSLGTNGACDPSDAGLQVVALADASGLTNPPIDVALDSAGNIYLCQSVGISGDPTPRVFKFPAYDPGTNSGTPEVEATWAVGGGDDNLLGASGVAVDPSGAYVAVTFEGLAGLPGNTVVFDTTNGAQVKAMWTAGSLAQQDIDCAWDEAGNLYYIENVMGVWRTVSPPGTNQFTTVAPATVEVTGNQATPPQITGISVSNGIVTLTFSASVSDTAGAFVVLSASTAAGPYAALGDASISLVSPGVFSASFPQSGSAQFYRVDRGSTPPPSSPVITKIAVSAGQVTLDFTGSSSDTAGSFKLLSSGSLGIAFSEVTGATFESLGAGSFRATAPTNGPIQFYRVQK